MISFTSKHTHTHTHTHTLIRNKVVSVVYFDLSKFLLFYLFNELGGFCVANIFNAFFMVSSWVRIFQKNI